MKRAQEDAPRCWQAVMKISIQYQCNTGLYVFDTKI